MESTGAQMNEAPPRFLGGVERVLDGLGGQLLAVVELDPLA